jgi:hypothetical protein
MMKYGFRLPPLGLQESRLEEYKGIREESELLAMDVWNHWQGNQLPRFSINR